MRRNFIIIAHRARSDPDFTLDDLCGSGGRWDGIARCINTALLVSHGIRRDSAIHICLGGEPDPGKVISLSGESIRGLNPDERSTAALMKKPLGVPLPRREGARIIVSAGVEVSRFTPGSFLDDRRGSMFLLDERGQDIFCDEIGIRLRGGQEPLYFVLSDDMDLLSDERESIEYRAEAKLSLGPVSMHSHQAIAVVNNLLDRLWN